MRGFSRRLIVAPPAVPPLPSSPVFETWGEPAFMETFDAPAAVRGRGGDLNAANWSTYRIQPSVLAGNGVNPIRHATIPSNNRASFLGGTSVYPPDDMLVCDGTSVLPGSLMTGMVIQDYGQMSIMRRQPFDFSSGRTGNVWCDVDAQCKGALATYITIGITDDPTPCAGYQNVPNQEAGPVPKNGVVIAFSGAVGDGTGGPAGGTNVGVSYVVVYTNYSPSIITASSQLTGTNLPTTAQDQPNRINVRINATTLDIWMSDCSTNGGLTFTNMRSIWTGSITCPLSRGYVHYGMRNHATVKFSFPTTHVYHWDNLWFDGPVIPGPRAYEILDNTLTGTSSDATELDFPYALMNLGYNVSDGSGGAGRAQGVWSGLPGATGASLVSPLSFNSSVDLTGKTRAQLSLTLFVQSITRTPDTSWGLLYSLNGNSFRTRLLTSAEANDLDGVTPGPNPGTSGFIGLLVDIPFGDLVNGTNTIDFSTVNVPMDHPPQIMNIDLLLWTN